MAIPVLFDPIKMNKTLYVDGGLTTNFPAEQCKAMGADYIIGNNAAIARVDMRVRVYKSHYLTAMVNYCRSSIDMNNFFKERSELQWNELYDYNASNWWGAGVRYSIDTKVGPLNFDVSSSNISKSVNLYFSFGYYF